MHLQIVNVNPPLVLICIQETQKIDSTYLLVLFLHRHVRVIKHYFEGFLEQLTPG